MVTDLVDENVAHDGAQRLAMLGPVVQNGAPVEKDHGLAAMGVPGVLSREVGTVKETENVEAALELHLVDHGGIGKIRDAEHDVARKFAEFARQRGKSRFRHCLKVFQGRRLDLRPIHAGYV